MSNAATAMEPAGYPMMARTFPGMHRGDEERGSEESKRGDRFDQADRVPPSSILLF
jgi:hypothetical protein